MNIGKHKYTDDEQDYSPSKRQKHNVTSHPEGHSSRTTVQHPSTSAIPSTSKRDTTGESNAKAKIFNAKLPIEMTDPDFPWFEYRHILNKIFFRNKDPIQRGTKGYGDFWEFLKKYQVIQQRAVEKHLASKCHDSTDNGPEKQDHFTIDPSTMKDMLMRGHLFKDDKKSKLNEERLTEFQYIINLYLNFLEKEKASKLQKLRDAQNALPIRKFKDDIVDAVKQHQVIVIAGDTGCGKSTQVPQYLLEAGYESIACTQPRRIACISLCKRVSYETQNEYGSEVGYQIRFEKSKTSSTKILFITEGLLLRQVSNDPMLSSYSVIIIDEVHERHLPCDFLLGVMKCLSVQRPDLKIILMSATINIELFSEYFNDCPVIQVPGRLFPIQVEYCPITAEEQKTLSGRLNPSPYVRIMNKIDHKYPEDERGDLLIFLSGTAEIGTVEEAVRMYAERTQKWIVLPLYSTLSLEEQDKVFDIAPPGIRKCIISTNIAETSVTIDGVRFVVDSGKVKEMSYDPTCHMQRLQEFCISRASAEQRKGRAGRTGPGVCFRMYAEKQYDAMSVYSKPEIQRVSLDSLLLQLISIGLPDARKFPFLEPPAMSSIEESLRSLKDQGALTEEEVMTPMGQMLARLPVEVTIGKMLIHGSIFSLVEPVLSLASALSVQSPFANRTMRDPEIMAARQLLDSDHGDPFTLLNVYHKWLQVKSDSRVNSKQWCRKRGLEEQRFYEMSKLRRQFKGLLKDAGLLVDENKFSSSYERSSRHGELKHLRDMKRQYHQTPQTRKILKIDTGLEGFAETMEDEDTGRIDIKDVEFRMSHNRKQVYELSSASQITSYSEIMYLKTIVCSGLYPRFAIADIHNSFKSDSDQHFHTKAKPFVVLHPNGVFALQPDLLKLTDSDIEEVHGFRSQTPLSTRHQLVAYMSLLETTKPFLVNCLRVSAAHILLLLSRAIDSNEDFTRIVCDGWLELRFPDTDVVQHLVSKAWSIRDTWQMLLKMAFEEFTLDRDRKMSSVRRKGEELLHVVAQYFQIEVSYCVKRLLAADIKHMYIRPQNMTSTSSSCNFIDTEGCTENPKKGGLQVKDYWTYNCLVDSEDKHLQYLQKHWVCPFCGQEMVATVLDQIRHKEKCQESDSKPKLSENVEEKMRANPLQKSYFCPECEKELHLSATEILKHKRSHAKSSS